MAGVALLCLSLTGGVMVIIALVTPGWLGLDFETNGIESKVAMSVFYTEVCFGTVCDTMDNTKAFQKYAHTAGYAGTLEFTRFMIEAVLSIIGVGIGTSLIAVYAGSVIQRERSASSVSSSSNSFPIAGLICNIIGVICGGIVCLELIMANVRVDDVISELDILTESEMKKIFPYSIVIMSIGLVLEFITIILTGVSTRSKARADGGIVLHPAGNASSVVVQQNSSVPYTQFA